MAYYKVADPEALVACPYNSTHMVRNKRMQYHIMDCRKQHLHLEMRTCPFNAKHIIPKMEFQFHLTHCDDRAIIDQDILYQQESALQREQQTGCLDVPQYNDINIDNEEDWDQELHGEPFSLQDEAVIKASSHPVLRREAMAPRLPKHEPQVLQMKDLESKRQPRHSNVPTVFSIEPTPMAVDGPSAQKDLRLPKTVPKVLQQPDQASLRRNEVAGNGILNPLPMGRGSLMAKATAETAPKPMTLAGIGRSMMLAGVGRGVASSTSAMSVGVQPSQSFATSIGIQPVPGPTMSPGIQPVPSSTMSPGIQLVPGLNRPIGRSSMLASIQSEPRSPGQPMPTAAGMKRGPPSSSSVGSTRQPNVSATRQPNVSATRQPIMTCGAPYAVQRIATTTTAFSLVGIGRGRGIQIQDAGDEVSDASEFER